jgi:hypothetical protein
MPGLAGLKLSEGVAGEGQQREMAGPLHFLSEFTLAFRTKSGLASWPNFATFGDVPAQNFYVLVIQVITIAGVARRREKPAA